MQAWRALLGTINSVRDLLNAELEAERGLQLTEYEILLRLYHAPGQRLRMQDLARGAMLSKSGLTQAIAALEQEGLVAREPVPGDRRGIYAVITPQGRRRFRRAAPVHLRGLNRHFGTYFTPEQAEDIALCLAKAGRAATGDARWEAWWGGSIEP